MPVETWSSMFWNDKLKCLLMVYVDDIKMAGPTAGLKAAWSLIRDGIETGNPDKVDKCLGCVHRTSKGTIPRQDARVPAASATGTPRPALSSPRVPAGKYQVNVQIMEYDVEDFMVECVTAYKTACGEPDMVLKKVDTPFIATPEGGGDAPSALVEGEPVGALQPIACSIMMKILYGARTARWDLL